MLSNENWRLVSTDRLRLAAVFVTQLLGFGLALVDDVPRSLAAIGAAIGAETGAAEAEAEDEAVPKNCKISRCFFSALSGDRDASNCFVPSDGLRRNIPGDMSGAANELAFVLMIRLLGLSSCCLAPVTMREEETLFISKLVGE